MAEKFDTINVGTSQLRPSLAQRMIREGMKTAIIEQNLFGGTCVNVVCILTKVLVASARADFGVLIKGDIDDDIKAVKTRKDAIVRQSNEGGTKWLKTMENLTIYEGHGHLESANTVRVNGNML